MKSKTKVKPASITPQVKKKTTSEGIKMNPFWLLIPVLIVTFLVYSNSFNNEMLNFDDNEYFADYPEVVNYNASHIKTYFSNYYVLMYQPLPIWSFAVTFKYFGLNPAPYHAVNLFFHLFNILVAFLFVRALTQKPYVALFVAAFFAIHPMNVEAVTWISARSSSMFVFFYLLSLLFYVKYHLSKFEPKHLVISCLFFILSLFSKAHAVTLPVIMVIIDIYFKRRWNLRFYVEKVPFFLLSLLFGIIAISDKGTTVNILHGLEKFTLVDNFFLLSYSVSFYIVRLFSPVNLCSVYVYPEKLNGALPPEYYIAPLLLAVLAFLVFRFRKKFPYLIFGTLFFLAGLSLTLQIIPSRLFIVTDRYTYLPYLGLLTIIGLLIFDTKSTTLRNALVTISVLAFVVFSVLSFNRNKVWANDLNLATDIINKNPAVPYIGRAYGVRANFYLNRLQNPQMALKDYDMAINLDQTDRITYYNRGVLRNKMQDNSGVIEDMEMAEKLGLRYHDLNNFLGAAYYNEGKLEKAVENFKKAIEINPGYIEAYNNLGATLGTLNQLDSSIYFIEKALELNPSHAESHRNRGILYLRENKNTEACFHFNKAKQLGSTTVDEFLSLYCK